MFNKVFWKLVLPTTVIMIHKYMYYGVLIMCPYLDHLMKSLQLPCGIIWICGTSYSVPRGDYGFSYNFTFNIYISFPLLGSRDFKNGETEGLKLVFDEKGFKSRQLASSVCGLSQYIILPSYIDHALLKTVAGWSFSSFILEILWNQQWYVKALIYHLANQHGSTILHQSFGYTQEIFVSWSLHRAQL